MKPDAKRPGVVAAAGLVCGDAGNCIDGAAEQDCLRVDVFCCLHEALRLKNLVLLRINHKILKLSSAGLRFFGIK